VHISLQFVAESFILSSEMKFKQRFLSSRVSLRWFSLHHFLTSWCLYLFIW